MTTTRKTYSPKFKARVALEALRGEKTLSQLGSQFKRSPAKVATALDSVLTVTNGVCSSDSIKFRAYLVEEFLVLSKDIHSLSDFKRNTGEFLEQMRGSGHPVILTTNGKAELVVQDALFYQKLLDRADKLEAIKSIQCGLSDVEAGRVTPLSQFEKEFRDKHGLPSRSR